jgi:hypothetical protein
MPRKIAGSEMITIEPSSADSSTLRPSVSSLRRATRPRSTSPASVTHGLGLDAFEVGEAPRRGRALPVEPGQDRAFGQRQLAGHVALAQPPDHAPQGDAQIGARLEQLFVRHMRQPG